MLFWVTIWRPTLWAAWTWRTMPWSRSACCGESESGSAARRPPAPGRIVKPLAPCVRKPSRAPARSLTSIRPTLPSVDRDMVRARGGCAFRHLDKFGGAANAERRGRRRYFHVAGLGDGGGNEGHGAPGDIEQRGVFLAAVLIDKTVDRDPRVGGEIESGGVVEGDAERGIRRCLQHVILENVVLKLERSRSVVAGDGRAAGQGGDVSDRLL